MLTFIFDDNTEGEYEDYVKYFFGTIRDYFELYPNTKMPLPTITKENFEHCLVECLHALIKPCPCHHLTYHRDEKYLDKICWCGSYAFMVYFKLVESNNRLTILQQLNNVMNFDMTTCICECCAEIGDAMCLEYARNNGCFCDVNVCVSAVEGGHLDCLKYLCEKCNALSDIELNSWCDVGGCMCESAAKNGHLDCLKYLYEHEIKGGCEACTEAAKHGHLDCLKFLHENECLMIDEACEAAAQYGHLECLKYLHENGCEWIEFTCLAAASGGHIECLEYAHKHGCEYDGKVIKKCSVGKCIDYAKTYM